MKKFTEWMNEQDQRNQSMLPNVGGMDSYAITAVADAAKRSFPGSEIQKNGNAIVVHDEGRSVIINPEFNDGQLKIPISLRWADDNMPTDGDPYGTGDKLHPGSMKLMFQLVSFLKNIKILNPVLQIGIVGDDSRSRIFPKALAKLGYKNIGGEFWASDDKNKEAQDWADKLHNQNKKTLPWNQEDYSPKDWLANRKRRG